jgi:amidohydrolase
VGKGSGAVAELFGGELRQRLLALRHDLHRHPELSGEEVETAARLEAELARLRPAALVRAAGTGVVARLAGRRRNAPVVALRGDVDALPIQEATGLPFASQRPGVMHACGHDVHAAWTVGAAALLAAAPAAGDVVILLQPSEESGNGAQQLIAAGAIDGVAAIFGGHVDRRFEVGQVVAQEGPLAASADSFEVELVGRGAHGARPQEAADPVVGAAALVGALQTVVSRRLAPGTPGVVSVGRLAAGTALNVIPESASLGGTLRATDPETRELLQREVRRIAAATAALYGLEAEVRIEEGTPPVVNAAEPAAWARRAVAELLGEEALVPLGQLNMAGEDFACYLERVPGCFLRIGAREPGGEVLAAHSPRFYAADEAVFVGAAVLAAVAREASAALASAG